MGGNNRKRSKSRKARNPSSLFVEGGALSDWAVYGSPGSNSNINSSKKNASASKSRSSNSSRGKEIGYVYPSANSLIGSDATHSGVKGNKLDLEHPILLVDMKETKIVAFIDEGTNKEPQNEGCIYDCTTPLSLDVGRNKDSHDVEYAGDHSSGFSLDESSHKGLGFFDDAETTQGGIGLQFKDEKEDHTFESSSSEHDMDADISFHGGVGFEIDDRLPAETSSRVKNEGFLSIGGLRIFTHDLSGEESDGDDEDISSDDGSSCSSESEESDQSDGSNGSYDSDSVDEEVAVDYYEGTGGDNNVVDVKKLVRQIPTSCSDDSFDETVERLGGIELQEASREYGMLKPQRERNYEGGQKFTPAKQVLGSALDDLMFVKDPRMLSRKKKHATKFPQSWPFESQKRTNFRTPGDKKKHRKEMIALKRRERMLHRGVDLQKINLKLQKMVLDGADIISFQPMHSRDCSQVQRLAAIYRLRSGCQGSGKKRFVTVTKTQHTSMPSASDKIRLEKLIGVGDEDSDFAVTGIHLQRKDRHATKKPSKGSGQSGPSKSFKTSVDPRGHKNSSKRNRERKTGSYASLPVSFVSSGMMQSETVEQKLIETTERTKECGDTNNSTEYGAFEMHTTGFGSKMMAKMGFQEGRGLGKDGQGIAEPIEVLQRPKALGLGAEVPESSNSRSSRKDKSAAQDAGTSGTVGFGGFEKHTKGFGSKMMAKMGFVQGMGLGKDSQGMVHPLVATRRPKSQGLGATSNYSH